MLKDTEHLEPLGAGIQVIVSPVHKFWTDTILLADFAAPKKHENAIDFGTGCATIPLLWCRDNAPKHICAVELQKDGAEMAQRSVELNGLTEKIDVLNADIRQLHKLLPKAGFDLAVCNPPYKHIGSGLLNPDSRLAAARHEATCTLEDVCNCAKAMLRFGGRLCICQRPERLSDVIDTMRSCNIEPKRLRLVQASVSKSPKLLLVEGKLGANRGGLTVMPALILDESVSDESARIYKHYRESIGGKDVR